FDANCERYAAGDAAGTISVRRVATGREVMRLLGPGAPVHEFYFSPDNRFLAASYNLPNKPLFLWDLATKQAVFKPGVTNFRTLDFTTDSTRIAVAVVGGPVRVYDTGSGLELQRIWPEALPYWLAF